MSIFWVYISHKTMKFFKNDIIKNNKLSLTQPNTFLPVYISVYLILSIDKKSWVVLSWFLELKNGSPCEFFCLIIRNGLRCLLVHNTCVTGIEASMTPGIYIHGLSNANQSKKDLLYKVYIRYCIRIGRFMCL